MRFFGAGGRFAQRSRLVATAHVLCVRFGIANVSPRGDCDKGPKGRVACIALLAVPEVQLSLSWLLTGITEWRHLAGLSRS